MLSRTSLIAGAFAAVFGAASFASAADRNARVVFIGGHDPGRITTIVTPREKAPYALTGAEQKKPAARFEAIRVGSRIVGYQVISK